MKICNNCSAQNPDVNEFCENCKIPLPPPVPGSSVSATSSFDVPTEDEMSRFNDIKNAVENVKNRAWSLQKFESFLQNLMKMLARFEQDIREVEIPEESYDDFAGELDIGFNGVDLYNEGLANLMLYVDDQNEAYLDQGLDLVFQGNAKINEAIRINRNHRAGMGEVQVGD